MAVRWQLNRLDRRRSLSHYWTSPSHQFWRTQGEKQPSHSYKQPGQTVKAAGLARTMSGALKLTREHDLVEGEKHQLQVRVRAVPLEKGPQRVGEVTAQRDVMAGVRSKPRGGRSVVIASRARVERHGQAVLGRHPRHLQQHVSTKRDGLSERRGAGQGRVVDPFRLGGLERLGPAVGVRVVRGPGAVGDEVLASFFHGPDPAGIAARVLPCLLYTSPSPRDRQKSRMP